MPKSPIQRYDRWGVPLLLAIIIGIGLSPSILFIFIGSRLQILDIILGFLSSSLLILGVSGIIIIRKKISALKLKNPEISKKLKNTPIFTKCAICGAEPAIRFRCYYCKKYFCEKHKLSKNHHCSMAPKASYRTVLLTCTLTAFIGIVLLPLSNLGLEFPFLGGFLIFFGTGTLIIRTWSEKQSMKPRAIDHDLSEPEKSRLIEQRLNRANAELAESFFELASEDYHFAAQAYLSLEDWVDAAKCYWAAADALSKESKSYSFGVASFFIRAAFAYLLSKDVEKSRESIVLARKAYGEVKATRSRIGGLNSKELISFLLDILDSVQKGEKTRLRESWSDITRKIADNEELDSDELITLVEKNLNS